MTPTRRPAAAGIRTRLGVVPAAVLLGLALTAAACSSGSAGTSAQGSTTTSTTTSGTTTTSGSTSTTRAGGTTTTKASGPGTCQPGQLSVTSTAGSAAAGTISLQIRMTNTSSATCTLRGYPGMQLLDAQGNPLPTNVVRGGATFPNPKAQAGVVEVTLAPGAVAAYTLTYEDVPVGGETSCPTSAKAEITPPNDYTHVVIALQITACGGGTIHVSPVYAAG